MLGLDSDNIGIDPWDICTKCSTAL